MNQLEHKVERAAFSKAIDFTLHKVNKDRNKGFEQIYRLSDRFLKEYLEGDSYDFMKDIFLNPENKWNRYINSLLDEIDPNVLKTTALNFGYEAFFHGTETIRQMRVKHQCNIPWLILMDPTSACNLHCTGCWAAQYGHKMNLTFDELDSIITQGKELGIYYYMYTGGEPLVRKKDIIRLCEKHSEDRKSVV